MKAPSANACPQPPGSRLTCSEFANNFVLQTNLETVMTASLTEDIAYLRDLAEAGRKAPLLGGRFLAWWGGLASLAYIGHFLIASGQAGLPPSALGWLWGGFVSIGFTGYFLLSVTFPKSKPGASSAGNRLTPTIFMAGGLALFAFFVGVVARSFVDGAPSVGFYWSVPLVLTVYGLGQLTSGLIADSKPLVFAGWGALIGVGLAAFFTSSNMIWLVGAATAALTVFLPGVLLMRREPSEIV
jgi:hypothetical protein